MNSVHRFLLSLILLNLPCMAAPHLPPGVQALPSSAPNGRGPLALVNLNHHVLGHAKVYGGAMPDLFLAGYGGPQAVHLFKWVATAESGAPVFAEPVEVKCAFKEKGIVFETKDRTIHGLWISKGELVQTLFDRDALEFRETGRVQIDKTIKSPASLTALTNNDGSIDLAFEMSNGAKGTPGDPWSESWRPFNSSGIAVGEQRYCYLSGAQLRDSQLGRGKQITASKNEVYFSMHGLASVSLDLEHPRDLITGSRQGNLIYYHNEAPLGFKLQKKRLVAGPDGNALRHPSINPSVCAYPSPDGHSDLIACGEGSLYFYRYSGKFTADGAPIYDEPVSVLQENSDLYAGTLPTPTTVDWNGDGRLDILVGNSEGFVLFFENIGSNNEPKFFPATRVQAGGRDIQVQAGYAGSLQGLQEARWGYLSPNAIDWNGDSLPDLITGDISGNYLVYLNRGTPNQPNLDPAHPLYCDGIDLHGMWRVRPAVGKIEQRMMMLIVDGDDHIHRYWRIDDYNVEDGGALKMEDGRPIAVSGGPAGKSGRCKLDLFDWNQDGVLDLVIGTNRVNAIPDLKTGFPMVALGKNPLLQGGDVGAILDAVLPTQLKKTIGTPLVMLNTGTNSEMQFTMPSPFYDNEGLIIQPGGAHETGAIGTMLGGNGPNLLICNEAGRMFLIPRSKLR